MVPDVNYRIVNRSYCSDPNCERSKLSMTRIVKIQNYVGPNSYWLELFEFLPELFYRPQCYEAFAFWCHLVKSAPPSDATEWLLGTEKKNRSLQWPNVEPYYTWRKFILANAYYIEKPIQHYVAKILYFNLFFFIPMYCQNYNKTEFCWKLLIFDRFWKDLIYIP